MKPGLVNTAVARSWTALFATLWCSRHDLHHNRFDLAPDGALAPERPRSERSWRRARRPKPGPDGVPTHTATSATGNPVHVSAPDASRPDDTAPDETEVVRDAGSVDGIDWFELDLFAPTMPRAGSRFDETVAHPIDTPRRLAAIVRAADLRLRALPDLTDLSHRTVTLRTRLQQVMHEAAQAQARLAEGTYGACRTCTRPIAFARLTERPWARLCIYCELDI